MKPDLNKQRFKAIYLYFLILGVIILITLGVLALSDGYKKTREVVEPIESEWINVDNDTDTISIDYFKTQNYVYYKIIIYN